MFKIAYIVIFNMISEISAGNASIGYVGGLPIAS
jgi:hypothetical protein